MLPYNNRRLRLVVPALLALALAGCTTATPAKPAVAPPTATAPTGTQPEAKVPAAAQPAAYVGKMTLTPAHGLPGSTVTVTGSGLPANSRMDLVWQTVDGAWDLRGEAREEYHGQKYAPVTRPLATSTTDAAGSLQATFAVPEDYGFMHNVTLVEGGVIRNQSSFSIDMTAKLAEASGPAGSPITIEVTGIGWQKMDSPWIVLYDNRFTGWLSATSTRGKARAIIPAVGSPGKHIIEILEGPFTFAYRSIQQSPVPYLKPITLEFTITAGDPVLPTPAQQSLAAVQGEAPTGTGAGIWTDPAAATVDTPVRLRARGLPPGKNVEFIWNRVVGNRIAGSGWRESTTSLGHATVDAGGNASLDFKVLDDLGGPHRIEAKVDEQVITSTSLTITPSARLIGPTSGPVGTEFGINLQGVGWTETANIYLVNYDNTYIGYTCGFNSQGNVTSYYKATGEPGWHFIDFYPGIYKGEEPIGVDMFRIPQLTYAQDHPGEKLPAFHFAFQVTP